MCEVDCTDLPIERSQRDALPTTYRLPATVEAFGLNNDETPGEGSPKIEELVVSIGDISCVQKALAGTIACVVEYDIVQASAGVVGREPEIVVAGLV